MFTFMKDGLRCKKASVLDSEPAKRPESKESAGRQGGTPAPCALLSSNLQMKGGSKWLRSS
jgi:hypothetical protein